MLADLSHDEAARQAYASTLRSYTMRVLDETNATICNQVIAPAIAAKGLAGREADRAGARIAIRVSDAAGLAAREAGFERFPGLAEQD